MARETDLPDAVIWMAAAGTVGVIWLINLAVSSNNPRDCTHEWAPAPRGWECHKCGKTTSNPPS